MRSVQTIWMPIYFIVVIATSAGCAYAKKEVVQTPCVIPAIVGYAANIAPIISSNCSGCHTGANTSGILLDNYNSVKAFSQNGRLYGAISHASGYSPMPKGGSKLGDCTIATIKKWIDSGMPQ